MKKPNSKFVLVGLLAAAVLSISALDKSPEPLHRPKIESESLKEQAFAILDTKCNVCHRKKNPFMVFSPKNMERRASKIYTQVFLKRRMPKPEGTPLTNQEHDILFQWLQTQKLK